MSILQTGELTTHLSEEFRGFIIYPYYLDSIRLGHPPDVEYTLMDNTETGECIIDEKLPFSLCRLTILVIIGNILLTLFEQRGYNKK